MSIWGHDTVQVEKDTKAKVWNVYTAAGALLVTIPWADARKLFLHAPDYAEALATCQSHPDTALTAKEEASVFYSAEEAAAKAAEAANVISVDFRKKRRL